MTHEDGVGPYPPHDLAPELDGLSVEYARLTGDVALLRAALAQAERAMEAERRARAIAEADNARLLAILRAVDSTCSRPKHIERLFAEVRTTDRPGAALLAELEASRAVVAAAREWLEAVETLDGVYAAEQALIAAVADYDRALLAE